MMFKKEKLKAPEKIGGFFILIFKIKGLGARRREYEEFSAEQIMFSKMSG